MDTNEYEPRILVLALLTAGLMLLIVLIFPRLLDLEEDVAFGIFPTATRAFAFGTAHFNPNDPRYYDIDRAEYFYVQALKLDPSLPYVYHQLARISFIKENFTRALVEIDLQIQNFGDTTPSSYYVRGLIEGYTGDYSDAENDYKHFLELVPHNWAGLNDYAWVLLKDNKPQAAATVTSEGLKYYPENPWLLNSAATALYEIGNVREAQTHVLEARAAVGHLSPRDWSLAYPGNNPDIAQDGLLSFKSAIEENIHTIFASSTQTNK